GTTGDDGPVVVEDLAPATFASVGVRGDYSARNYEKGLTQLRDFLESHGEWRPAGEPRYLGYNGPLTLWFLRYGEVQVPVEPAPWRRAGGRPAPVTVRTRRLAGGVRTPRELEASPARGCCAARTCP